MGRGQSGASRVGVAKAVLGIRMSMSQMVVDSVSSGACEGYRQQQRDDAGSGMWGTGERHHGCFCLSLWDMSTPCTCCLPRLTHNICSLLLFFVQRC